MALLHRTISAIASCVLTCTWYKLLCLYAEISNQAPVVQMLDKPSTHTGLLIGHRIRNQILGANFAENYWFCTD